MSCRHGVQANADAIRRYLDALPWPIIEALDSATLDDGTMLLNNVEGLEWLLSLTRVGQRTEKAELKEIRE